MERPRDEYEYKEDRAHWVRDSGSERLRMALDLGLIDQSDKVYREERLRQERPGWVWAHELPAHEAKQIRNPSVEAMRALAEARAADPAATLAYLVLRPEETEHPTAHTVQANGKGPAVLARFLGAPIYRLLWQ